MVAKKEAEVEVRYCEECGEPISPARLRAVPNTTLCIDCAEELEATNPGAGRRYSSTYIGARHDEDEVVRTLRDLTES